MDATIVTQEELKKIQQMTTDFNQAKMALGKKRRSHAC